MNSMSYAWAVLTVGWGVKHISDLNSEYNVIY